MGIVEQSKEKMRAAIDHLKMDLKAIRTGRANPAMLDAIHVEVYGTNMRIKDLGSISAPEPKQLLITPFDPKNVSLISKAIEKANIGMMPILDGHGIRLKIPPMDEAMRKEMVKICHKKREDSKISIRNIRRDANDQLKKQKVVGEIAEDLLKQQEKMIQDLTDTFCGEADEVSKQKEKEVIHV
jgi:ribosome recycling factor